MDYRGGPDAKPRRSEIKHPQHAIQRLHSARGFHTHRSRAVLPLQFYTMFGRPAIVEVTVGRF